MSEPYVGEIKMFAGTFAPRGWALCDGQLLAVSQNDALFSLFGTIYGGDGRTTFGLPDLRGRLPVHAGSGPGLTPRPLGQKTGSENETVTVGELHAHRHDFQASTASGSDDKPINHYLASSPTVRMYRPVAPNTQLNSATTSMSGGTQPHTNVMPFLCVNFIVALVGIYPSRN